MNIVVVLDNIRSLHNVGSIFRTSDAAGVDMLYLCGYTPTPDHHRFAAEQAKDSLDASPGKHGKNLAIISDLAKTALTGLKTVPWKHFKTTVEAVKSLKEQGFYVVALELSEESKIVSKRQTSILTDNRLKRNALSRRSPT